MKGNLTIAEIAWLAGIIEGEGWFGFGWAYNLARRHIYSPRIDVQMIDRDVIEKIANICNVKVYGPYKTAAQPRWVARCNGTKAIGFVFTIYSFLGTRRRLRLNQIIKYWKSAEAKNCEIRCIK